MSELGVTKERFCCIDCASSCSPKLFSFDLYWILTFVCFGNAFWHGLLLCPLLRLNWQCILWLVFISFHFRFCFLIWLLSVNYDIVYLYMIVFIQMFVCMCMFVYVWMFMFVCVFVGRTHARRWGRGSTRTTEIGLGSRHGGNGVSRGGGTMWTGGWRHTILLDIDGNRG